ncbi:hypothetical protein [Pseudonocardia sp.]|uniref:hypothetical protein n=1 Tax=Pseudonocardia sp. TaxID=60912 RepID=UPI0026377495|nr:hypothetical protein [Pseudonocardia sp.]MCW2719038.1 hypothetical protein [Pseudonocardia sp.]
MRTGARTQAALVALMAVAGLSLVGCDRSTASSAPAAPAASSSTADPLGSLEAGVDAISRQVDSDTAG